MKHYHLGAKTVWDPYL